MEDDGKVAQLRDAMAERQKRAAEQGMGGVIASLGMTATYDYAAEQRRQQKVVAYQLALAGADGPESILDRAKLIHAWLNE